MDKINAFLESLKSGVEDGIDAVLGWIGEAKAQITDEIVEGIAIRASQLINDLFNGITEGLFNTYSPSFATWDAFLGEEIRELLIRGSQIFGAGLMFVLIICYIIQFLMNPRKQKLLPWGVLVRVAGASIAIYMAPEIINTISETAVSLQEAIFTYASDTFKLTDLLFISIKNGTLSYLGVSVAGMVTPLIVPCFMIICLAFSWQLIKNFFRYLLEMVERYIICCLLFCLFPAAVGTITLDSTDNIFKSYLRMLGGQLFLLATSGIFLKGFIALVVSGNVCNIPGFIFALGYLRIIQRLDSYLNAMGINIAQTSGGLMDAIGGAVRSIGNGFRQANSLRKAAGEGMKAIGVATQNQGLFNKGAMLGMNARSLVSEGLPTQANLNNAFLSRSAKEGLSSVNMNPEAAAGIIGQYLGDPLNNAKAIGAMSTDSIAGGLEHLCNGISDIENVTVGNKGIEFDGICDDGNMKHFSLSASDNGLGEYLTTQNGEGIGFLNSQNMLSNGEMISVGENGSTYQSILEDTGCMGLQYHSDLGDRIKDIRSAEQSGNYTCFMDENGHTIATADRTKNMVYQADPLINDGRISEETSARIISEAKDIYKNYEIGKNVQYDKSSNAAYLEVKTW